MTEARCDRDFEEALLSGYVDRMLAQGDRQRVERHVEGCEACSALLESLVEVRSAALDTSLWIPPDDQWDERPRTPASRWTRNLGWILLLLWCLGFGVFGLVHFAVSGEPWWEKLAVFGGLGAGGILLISALLDRLHVLRDDPYRNVHR
ncbi:MAG: zf-HC2 domain-containing protein [Thermoanaerobaculia bacterium]|nr:zf-HC2 domain-containing protein [Thermoanaerobaculia bacterium]